MYNTFYSEFLKYYTASSLYISIFEGDHVIFEGDTVKLFYLYRNRIAHFQISDEQY